jgi:uncharacterized protein
MVDSQEEIVAFLSNGASYGRPAARVDRIETHCSIVFLVADRAYKLKRPVTFSSLDYSTLERREAACRAELALNRRTAPELYLGIHAIRRREGGELGFDGDGPILDWVVAMRRFDQADLLDHLAEAGRVTTDMASAMADEIARFHEAAERTPDFGGAAGLRAAIERNRHDQHTMDEILDRESVEALYRASMAALDRLGSLLDRRRDEGRVRRCHGDLRLANLCLADDRPTPFDGIEFCDQISCIDVVYDLAFLLVDLHHRGFEMLANLIFNRYLDATRDDGGLAALPLMLSVRAGTRAYTLAGAMLRQARRREARHRAAALAYLDLAASLLAAAAPRVIAVGGVGGGTKSALLRGIASSFRPAPGARILSSTAARRRLLDLRPDARLSAAAYGAETTAAAYQSLAAEAADIVRAGYTAIIAASFMDREQREAIAASASTAGVPFVGLWLGAKEDLQGGAARTGEWRVIDPVAGEAAMVASARILAHGVPTLYAI